jgi:hypothetical protein
MPTPVGKPHLYLRWGGLRISAAIEEAPVFHNWK